MWADFELLLSGRKIAVAKCGAFDWQTKSGQTVTCVSRVRPGVIGLHIWGNVSKHLHIGCFKLLLKLRKHSTRASSRGRAQLRKSLKFKSNVFACTLKLQMFLPFAKARTGKKRFFRHFRVWDLFLQLLPVMYTCSIRFTHRCEHVQFFCTCARRYTWHEVSCRTIEMRV